MWPRQFFTADVKLINEKVCQVWLRCSPSFSSYPRKTTGGGGQNDPPPGRRLRYFGGRWPYCQRFVPSTQKSVATCLPDPSLPNWYGAFECGNVQIWSKYWLHAHIRALYQPRLSTFRYAPPPRLTFRSTFFIASRSPPSWYLQIGANFYTILARLEKIHPLRWSSLRSRCAEISAHFLTCPHPVWMCARFVCALCLPSRWCPEMCAIVYPVAVFVEVQKSKVHIKWKQEDENINVHENISELNYRLTQCL